jgi:hypothetical protein
MARYDGDLCLLDDLAGTYQVNRGTGLMMWSDGFGAEMYEAFRDLDPAIRNDVYRVGGGRSDQLFINHHMPVEPHRFQTLWPGQIVSYKINCRNGIPNNARIMCFHGKTKPKDVRQHLERIIPNE